MSVSGIMVECRYFELHHSCICVCVLSLILIVDVNCLVITIYYVHV